LPASAKKFPAQKSSLPRQKNFPAPTLVEIRKLRIPQRDRSINGPAIVALIGNLEKFVAKFPPPGNLGIKPDPACAVGEM
jgi:hypothetical protein